VELENYFISQFGANKIGDDAACVDGVLFSKDAFFEGVHFKREWLSYRQIAKKAMMVNISDAVAMNARPSYALLAVAMPNDVTRHEAKELAKGFEEAAAEFGLEIIGGDTIANSKLDITVTIISHAKKPLFRKGLKCGHLLAYTGTLGKSAKELKKLLRGGKIHHRSKFVNLHLRDRFVAKSRRFLSCGMDISDGLFSDLGKLADQNRLGFTFLHSIAKETGCSGEEYEMLVGFDARYKKAIMRQAKRSRTAFTIFAKAVRRGYKNRCKEHHFG